MTGVPYTIVRRPKRRTVSITISRENHVRVLAPPNVPEHELSEFIQEKELWIKKVIEKNTQSKPEPYQFIDGEAFYYLGATYPLRIVASSENKIVFQNKQLCVFYKGELDKAQCRKRLQDWYKERAKEIVLDRVDTYATKMGLTYNNVRIKTLKSRWGSCSSLKNLNFNWTLMMAPMPVLDYVVVHELAHLVHMNHSKSFWNLVAQYFPGFKGCKKWLNDNVGLLYRV